MMKKNMPIFLILAGAGVYFFIQYNSREFWTKLLFKKTALDDTASNREKLLKKYPDFKTFREYVKSI